MKLEYERTRISWGASTQLLSCTSQALKNFNKALNGGEVDDGVTDQQTLMKCQAHKMEGACQIPLHHSTGAFGEFLQGMSSYDCSYDIWCSNYIYVMVESCLIQEMHSVIIPYLIPYYHQPENQELDPIKAATHNVSQLTNEHGTVCSLMQVGTRLLSIFQLDTWTSYMTPSNIHANGLKMLKESDEGRIL